MVMVMVLVSVMMVMVLVSVMMVIMESEREWWVVKKKVG
jgi:hypothetical protein